MPIVGFPDVCVDGTQVVGEWSTTPGPGSIWFDAVERATAERPLYVRAVSVSGVQVAIYKGADTDKAYLINDSGTEVELGATIGNQCVGIRSVAGGIEAVWVESQTVYKTRRYSTALAPTAAVVEHDVPASLVGHMGTGFLDLDASGDPIWTDAHRFTTVKGVPLIFAVRRGQYYIGQLGGGFGDQIVAVHAQTGARGTLYEGLGLEPHAALASDGSGDVYVCWRTLGSEGAQFVTIPPLPTFTGTVSEQAQNAAEALSGRGGPVPLQHPVVDPRTHLRMTQPWATWARGVDQAIKTPINLSSDVVGVLPPSNLGTGDSGPNTVLRGDGTFGPSPATLTPADSVADLDGSGDAGVSTEYSRGDHKHADANRPTDDEKAALAGTDGTPSAANPYVTDSDPRNANDRDPTPHADTHEDGGGDDLDVTALAGFPGGGTTFLRDDGTFASPGAIAHTVLTADPGAPSDDTFWVVREGTSPTMTISLKVRVGGVTYTVAAITV